MDFDLGNLKRVKQYESLAVNLLDTHAKYYFCAGASSNFLNRDNEEAFQRYRIRPKVLQDVSNAEVSCEIFNSKVTCPIGIAPTGFHFFAHQQGEIATALGAAHEGCIYIMSCVSSSTIEAVAESIRDTPSKSVLWMQLYIFKDRSVTVNLLRRAEACGFSAIVVTLDAPISGQWKTDLPDGFVDRIKERYRNLPCPAHYLHDDSITFEDLKWLRQQTKLPIVAKGILRGEDAKEAIRNGANAIYVSNHGGRQIHRVVPTVTVLEEVTEAVKEHGVDIYLDGGITSGSDIFIALALGAKAVFIGRPIIWGLKLGGKEGVRRILHILREELLSTMKLSGVRDLKSIEKSMVQRI